MKRVFSRFFPVIKEFWEDCGSYFVRWLVWFVLVIIMSFCMITEPFVSILDAGYTDQIGAGMIVAFFDCTICGALVSVWMLLVKIVRKSPAPAAGEDISK